MIDKSIRKTTATRHGPMVTVSVTGGLDCLWLLIYLDCEHGQMTCDSDIGSYAYHWGNIKDNDKDFLRFFNLWLANEGWLDGHRPVGGQQGQAPQGERRQRPLQGHWQLHRPPALALCAEQPIGLLWGGQVHGEPV